MKKTLCLIFVVFGLNTIHAGSDGLNVSESCVDDGSYCFPRIVWTFWDGNLPEDVEEMLGITRKAFTHFDFFFLVNSNLSNFLNTIIPPVLHGPSERADYIRVCLVEKYGGMWMDAGTIVNSQDEMENILSDVLKKRCTFVGFVPVIRSFRFIAGFFGAPKNSSFMKVLKLKYEEMIRGNMRKHISKSCKAMRSQGYKIDQMLCIFPVFAIDFLFHKINFENPGLDKTTLHLPQNRSIIRLQEECAYSKTCVVCRVLHDVKTREIPFIHLGRTMRNGKKLLYAEGLDSNKRKCHKHTESNHKKHKLIKRKIGRLKA